MLVPNRIPGWLRRCADTKVVTALLAVRSDYNLDVKITGRSTARSLVIYCSTRGACAHFHDAGYRRSAAPVVLATAASLHSYR